MLLPALVLMIAQPPVDSLASVLERLYWNVASRGPLLIVAPEFYKPVAKPDALPPSFFFDPQQGDEDDTESVVTPPALPTGPLNPTVLLPRYGAQVYKLPGLSVVAPTRLAVPRRLELTVDQLEGMADRKTTLYKLLLTLDTAQARAIKSRTGLGEEQLDSGQKKLFQLLLPSVTNLYFTSEPPLPPSDIDNPIPLPPRVRQGIRLRLQNFLSVWAFAPAEKGDIYTLGERENTDPEGKLRRIVLLAPEKEIPDEALEPSTTLPARLKPTQLDPASPALDALIRLEGAATVGELVRRIASATRLSLLCDKRVEGRRVMLRGKGVVRAGTVLQALCHGLQGAVRKLDSLYLLTADRLTELEHTEQEALAGQALNTAVMARYNQEKADALLARGELIRRRFAADIPRREGSLASEALWKVGEKYVPARRSDDDEAGSAPPSVPLTSLPPFFQTQAQNEYQKRLTEHAGLKDKPERPPSPPAQVSAKIYLRLEALVPSLGARAVLTSIPLEELHPDTPLPEAPPPVAWPKTAVRAWHVPLPADDSEATMLLNLAKSRGVTELRVTLPVGDALEKRLAALAVSAKAAGLKLIPVLRLLEPTSVDVKRDVDVLGRTALQWKQLPVGNLAPVTLLDYAEPEAVEVPAFVARCLRLASLPGVSGLALSTLVALGYSSGDYYTEAIWQGGGQWRERLAFVLKEHLDPADLQGSEDAIMEEVGGRWQERKDARRDALLTRLDVALKAAKLPVPLSAEGQDGWERWRPSLLKSASINRDEEPSRERLLPTTARPVLYTLSLEGMPWRPSNNSPATLLDPTGQLRFWLQKTLDEAIPKGTNTPARYDGIVLDLSELTLAAGLALVESALKPL